MAKNQYLSGINAIEEAFLAGKPLQKILLRKGYKLKRDELWEKILRDVPLQEVPPQKFKRQGFTTSNITVLAEIAPVSYHRSGDLVSHLYDRGVMPRLAILDGITDVRNFGAIARSALCFDFHGLVIPQKGTALVTSDAINTSGGALYHLPVCREPSLEETIKELHLHGLQTIACSEQGDAPIAKADLGQPTGLVFGSEEEGISPKVEKLCNHHVYIPMRGPVGSLNVSVASAVCFYEAFRQADIEKDQL